MGDTIRIAVHSSHFNWGVRPATINLQISARPDRGPDAKTIIRVRQLVGGAANQESLLPYTSPRARIDSAVSDIISLEIVARCFLDVIDCLLRLFASALFVSAVSYLLH